MTKWRIYSADVKGSVRGEFIVTTYNMFGKEIEQKTFESSNGLYEFLDQCEEIEPKFQYTFVV